MARVAPINLAYTPRTLWFDPCDVDVRKGDSVVVETARGIEFGTAADDIIEVSDAEIEALKSPLKPVLRIASEEDAALAKELEQKSREALPVFKEMAAEAHPDMHPVSVEFLLDGDKAVFYFEAEERIDFRELVRRLASHFKVRIDMRQIGVRDEARIVGGLGHCGQELCCKRMGGEFCPVSIRMAKEQDLSLNPQKISGLCGRLMCCLRYEYEAYKDFKSRAPKMNASIQTPAGLAKVVELDVPREIVSLKVGDEKPVKVPLADFDEPSDGGRPTSVGSDAWDEATAESVSGYKGDPITFMTSQFTGADKLAEKGSVRHSVQPKSKRKVEEEKPASSGRSRGKGKAKASAASEAKAPVVDETRKPRRRRSTKLTAGEGSEAPVRTVRFAEPSAVAGEAAKPERSRRERSRDRKKSVEQDAKQPVQKKSSDRKAEKDAREVKDARPGRRSSGVRRASDEGAKQKPAPERADKPAGEQPKKRRQRRRSRKSGGEGAASQGGAE